MKKKFQRTCIGCKKTSDKSNLIRIVKTPDRNIKIDVDKKLPGRGAYICPNTNCIELALKNRLLDKVFKDEVLKPNKRDFFESIDEKFWERNILIQNKQK